MSAGRYSSQMMDGSSTWLSPSKTENAERLAAVDMGYLDRLEFRDAAAVDDERLARHPIAVRARQEEQCAQEVLRLPEPLEGELAYHFPRAGLGDHSLVGFGPDSAGRDGIDVDAERAQLPRKIHGEPD